MLNRIFEQLSVVAETVVSKTVVRPSIVSQTISANKPPKDAIIQNITNILEKAPNLLANAPKLPFGPKLTLGELSSTIFDPANPHLLTLKSNGLRLVIAMLENLLNQQIYGPAALKSARERLIGKSITFNILELNQPITVVFSESMLDLLMTEDYSADCQLITDFATLKRLQDKQQLTELIKTESIKVIGDLDILQRFAHLIDQMDKSVATVLSPIIGDIPAVIIEKQLNIFINILIKGKQLISNRDY